MAPPGIQSRNGRTTGGSGFICVPTRRGWCWFWRSALAATSLSLIQPFLSKLLIDGALLKHDMHALVLVSVLMFVATVAGFVLNIVSSYRYVTVSAEMLFDMRLALFRHLQKLSPRFYAQFRLGDLMSRLNNDIGEVQRVSADTLLSVLSNVVFLVGSIAMMLWLNWRLFFISVILIPACIYTFFRFQKKLVALTALLRARSADLGSLFRRYHPGHARGNFAAGRRTRSRPFPRAKQRFRAHHAGCADRFVLDRRASRHYINRGYIGCFSVWRVAYLSPRNVDRNASRLHGVLRAADVSSSESDGPHRRPGFRAGLAGAYFRTLRHRAGCDGPSRRTSLVAVAEFHPH